MDFISFVIKISSKDDVYTNVLEDSIHAYAAILHVISNGDPTIGKSLHDLGPQRRMTLVVLPNGKRKKLIRLTFLSDTFSSTFEPLIRGLATTNVIHLGKNQYQFEGVDLNHHCWGRKATWEDFLSREVCHHIRMEFVSPTAIMRTGQWGRYSYLLPDPSAVFLGLLRKWKDINQDDDIDSLELENFISSGGCVVSDIKIRVEDIVLAERIQKGFYGSVTYELRESITQQDKLLNELANFAYYAGVGYQTARGMGAVKVFLGS